MDIQTILRLLPKSWLEDDKCLVDRPGPLAAVPDQGAMLLVHVVQILLQSPDAAHLGRRNVVCHWSRARTLDDALLHTLLSCLDASP